MGLSIGKSRYGRNGVWCSAVIWMWVEVEVGRGAIG